MSKADLCVLILEKEPELATVTKKLIILFKLYSYGSEFFAAQNSHHCLNTVLYCVRVLLLMECIMLEIPQAGKFLLKKALLIAVRPPGKAFWIVGVVSWKETILNWILV